MIRLARHTGRKLVLKGEWEIRGKGCQGNSTYCQRTTNKSAWFVAVGNHSAQTDRSVCKTHLLN